MIQDVKTNENLQSRPPVVVVLGHVDHGKSSILEKIKDLKITEKESGGITQHIGAYEVEHEGKKITFIDTPGHEAFSAMRARGARVADLAILVVAAEEGVKPQTKEAISHIKESDIPFIVTINKIDKPEANPEKVIRDLAKEDVLAEKLGGKIPFVKISAKTGQGIPDLLEVILLVAEMEKLKADISKPAEGVIIESYLDSQRGPTATLILQNGILKLGDVVGTPSVFGKVKSLEDFKGYSISQALPSSPAILVGFEGVPKVGEEIKFFSDINSAKNCVEKTTLPVLETAQIEKDKKVLNLILKADVLGSIEAIEEVLKNIPQEKVALKVLKAEVGQVNESDVKLAKGARAKILSFRVKTDPIAAAFSERERIKITTFDIIYDLVRRVRELMENMMTDEVERVNLGKVKVLAVFRSEKNRQIVGGRVTEGEVRKGARIETLRNEEVVGQGRLISLQRNKKDVDKVIKGDECGVLYEGSAKIENGDTLTFYVEERKKGEL